MLLFSPVAVLKSLKESVRSLTARPFWLRYATLAPYRALCAGTSAITGRTMSGAAHAERNVEEALGYITSVFNVYKTVSGTERFHGKVAEIGPGDSCGIGLMFLAEGCREVHLVDRFFSERDERHQQAINRAILERFPVLSPLRRNGDFSESSFNNLVRHYGRPAETFFDVNRGYDCIVSCAVLEHVYDPLQAMSAMIAALNPGGIMVHQVDCRDHGQFSAHFHELKFLELPAAMYAPLKWGGGPNRVRLSSYTRLLREAAVDFQVHVGALAGSPEFMHHCQPLEQLPQEKVEAARKYVARVRNHLAMPFREMSDEDLMVMGFTIAVRKKQQIPRNSGSE